MDQIFEFRAEASVADPALLMTRLEEAGGPQAATLSPDVALDVARTLLLRRLVEEAGEMGIDLSAEIHEGKEPPRGTYAPEHRVPATRRLPQTHIGVFVARVDVFDEELLESSQMMDSESDGEMRLHLPKLTSELVTSVAMSCLYTQHAMRMAHDRGIQIIGLRTHTLTRDEDAGVFEALTVGPLDFPPEGDPLRP